MKTVVDADSCLGVPDTWVNELFEREYPQFSERFVYAGLEFLNLSFFPKFVQQYELDLDAVCQDLSAGFQLGRWEERKGGVAYSLTGQRFRLVARPREGKQTKNRLAEITRVEPEPPKTLRDWEIVTRIQAHPMWDERPCDLEELWRCVHEEHNFWQRERQRAWKEKRSQIARPADVGQPADEERLHGLVRRNFGALRTMLSLLQTRAEVEQAANASGTIEAGMQDGESEAVATSNYVPIRVTTRSGLFEEGNHIEVVANGQRAFHSKIEEIDGDLFYLPEPDDLTLTPGTKVTFAVQPRFSMRSHARALDRFLKMGVEGEWRSLAALLCEPGSLPRSEEMLPPERFFAEADGRKLNDEQKRAVEGALATPHAFFIQGPPGTGKTTVICEIVQHLVERGERVLMLAPTHVAVDEVLRRVGQKPGVLPVRLAWSDAKVDASVRQFTPANVAQELVKKIRQPNASRARLWERTVERLETERERVERWQRACEACKKAQEKSRSALKQLEETLAQVKAGHEKIAAELAGLSETLPQQEAALPKALEMAKKLREDLEARRRSSNRWEKALAVVGVGELAEAGKQLQEAEEKRDKVKTRLDTLRSRRDRLEQDLKNLAERQRAEIPELERKLKAAEDARAAATRERADVLLELEISDGPNSGEEIAAFRESIHRRLGRIQHYAKLEQRWFEITGLSSTSGRSAVEDVAEQIGEDLLDVVNLVCCTTTGIAGQIFTRDASFDTLIVDEASRVTDSEFLIGAVRARRWILVGDEHQLPPYVETADEYHIHAMAALQRSQGTKKSLPEAVDELGVLWEEDEEQHLFRRKSVLETAERLSREQTWSREYQPGFLDALKRLKHDHEKPERALLQTMLNYLVRSLFERCVVDCCPELRQRLAVQRRMIEPIARIVAEPIYGGQYRSPSPEELASTGVTPLTNATFRRPIVFLDTSLHGERARDEISNNGFINPLEVEWIVNACHDYDRALREQNEDAITVSILCFYRAQAREIRQKLGWPRPSFSKLDFRVIDAIDRIQGQESDLVFLSFCRTHRGGSRSRFRAMAPGCPALERRLHARPPRAGSSGARPDLAQSVLKCRGPAVLRQSF